MPDQTHGMPRARFGQFEVDRSACALFRNGQRIPLQIQPFHVLEALIDSAGQVVTRESLYAKLCPGKAYIDVDRGLNNAVNRMRQAIGDSGVAPVYIETLPRIGYRFIHPLEPATATSSSAAEHPEVAAAESDRPGIPRLDHGATTAARHQLPDPSTSATTFPTARARLPRSLFESPYRSAGCCSSWTAARTRSMPPSSVTMTRAAWASCSVSASSTRAAWGPATSRHAWIGFPGSTRSWPNGRMPRQSRKGSGCAAPHQGRSTG